MGEDRAPPRNISKRMSLVIGARRHLEWGHEKYVMDLIQNHPAQVKMMSFCQVHQILSFRSSFWSL